MRIRKEDLGEKWYFTFNKDEAISLHRELSLLQDKSEVSLTQKHKILGFMLEAYRRLGDTKYGEICLDTKRR